MLILEKEISRKIACRRAVGLDCTPKCIGMLDVELELFSDSGRITPVIGVKLSVVYHSYGWIILGNDTRMSRIVALCW